MVLSIGEIKKYDSFLLNHQTGHRTSLLTQPRPLADICRRLHLLPNAPHQQPRKRVAVCWFDCMRLLGDVVPILLLVVFIGREIDLIEIFDLW